VKHTKVDKKTRLSDEEKVRLLRTMITIRHFELAVQEHYMNTNIRGFAHMYLGEEATGVGVCAALKNSDCIVSSHRGHGHCIAKGADIKKLMAELFGKSTGYCRGRGGSMHMFSKELGILGTSGIVGGGLPLAVGAALHAKMRKSNQVIICFFGDGAANQGTFHESINLAAVHGLPVVFVCENNLYATETPVTLVTLTKDFADRAAGYGIPGVKVDGNSLLKVYETTRAAVERARSGEGPTLLECKTYRTCGHYIGHGETGYRSKEEVELWRKRDPIERFSKYLIEHGILDRKSVARIEEEVESEVKEAVRFALESPYPDKAEVLKDVFA